MSYTQQSQSFSDNHHRTQRLGIQNKENARTPALIQHCNYHHPVHTVMQPNANPTCPTTHTAVSEVSLVTFAGAGQDAKDQEMRIQHVVSQDLYKEVKFIRDQAELDAYVESDTLGFYVMEKLNVAQTNRSHYWSTYKEVVNKRLNNLRSTHTNAIRTVWRGM
jgi:hypothetical protein